MREVGRTAPVIVKLRTGLDPFPVPREPAPPFLASLMFTAEDPWSDKIASVIAGREGNREDSRKWTSVHDRALQY